MVPPDQDWDTPSQDRTAVPSGGSRISQRGVPQPQGGRRQHTICLFFPENCMKMKKFWAGGARVPCAPLRSATGIDLNYHTSKICFTRVIYHQHGKIFNMSGSRGSKGQNFFIFMQFYRPHPKLGVWYPLTKTGIPPARTGRRYPPPRPKSRASTCSTQGGMPLAVTQEVFLVSGESWIRHCNLLAFVTIFMSPVGSDGATINKLEKKLRIFTARVRSTTGR